MYSVNLIFRHNSQGLVYAPAHAVEMLQGFSIKCVHKCNPNTPPLYLLMWIAAWLAFLSARVGSRTYWYRWKLISMNIISAALVYRQSGDVWTQLQALRQQVCNSVDKFPDMPQNKGRSASPSKYYLGKDLIFVGGGGEGGVLINTQKLCWYY